MSLDDLLFRGTNDLPPAGATSERHCQSRDSEAPSSHQGAGGFKFPGPMTGNEGRQRAAIYADYMKAGALRRGLPL